ncbi:MAG: hypothetical protein KKG92_04070 [Gammaproteobacteria bacterium]|nr:hypothetical protein [Gammaproteobacteria bacterium]
MEWLIGSALILIASTSTIAALAISGIIFLVLGQALALLYRSFAQPQEVAPPHSRDSVHSS